MGATYSSNQNNEPSNEDNSEDEEFIAVSEDSDTREGDKEGEKEEENSMDPKNFTTDATEIQPIISQPSFWQSFDLRAVTELPYISWMTLNKLLTSVSSGAGSSTKRKNSAEGQIYNIDPANPGICLIINQQNFYHEPHPALQDLLSIKDLDERIGTDIDRDRLKETFELFGFKVIVENNLYHTEIIHAIKETARMVTNHSSLIICILSHGIQGAVYGVNSISVKVSKIQSLMDTKNLRNKPKVLILQACQGTECQIVTEDNEDETILITEDDEDETMTTDGPAGATPTAADMVTFWATVPGYSAVRDEAKGTWFIQSLCKNIRSHAERKHFQDICTLVINDIKDKRWGKKAMVPLHESTLSRFFFLPPIKISINR